MSREVDERVVQMRFENQQFESGARETRRTLDNLRQSLSFDGVSTKGLSYLGERVSAISEHFSAMGVIADRVLQRIADKAFYTGEKIVKALTIQGADDGYQEYEHKMGSVQTIMNSSGASLEKVNQVLEELNVYADKTIYSFSDMTSSIGKFTNAGVDLDEAVKAIQGVSNEAALSGANANEASRAMYNFAQALSSGVVRLIDWKSIENANMATKEFKNELIKTALELGTVEKEGDKFVSTTADMNGNISDAFDAVSNFNNSLSSQWLTSDVLIKTFSKYADETTELGKRAYAAAQEVKTFHQFIDTLKEAVGSGWAQSFEILVGDFNEAKALWTDVNKVFSGIVDSQAKARNDLLQGWKDLGGRADLIASLANVWKGLSMAVDSVTTAMRTIFPPITAKNLTTFTARIREATDSFVTLSEGLSGNVHDAFLGIFSVLDMGKDMFSAFIKVVMPYTSIFSNIGEQVLDNVGKLGKWIASVRDGAKESDLFFRSLSDINEKFRNAALSLRPFVDLLKSRLPEFYGFSEVLTNIKNSIREFDAPLARAKNFLVSFFSAFFNGGENIDALELFSKVLDTLENGLHNIGSLFSNFKQMIINFELSEDTIAKLWNTFSGLFSVIDLIQQAFSAFFRVLSEHTIAFDDFQNGVFSFGRFLEKVVDGVLSLTGWIGNLVTILADSARESDFFYNTFSLVADILSSGFGVFRDLLNFVKSHLPSIETFDNMLSSIADTASPLADIFGKAADAIGGFFNSFRDGEKKIGFFEKLGTVLSTIWGVLSKVGTFLSDVFVKAFTFFANSIANLDSSKLFDFIAAGSLFSATGGVVGFINSLRTTLTSFGNILGSFKGVMDGVTRTLKAMQMKVKAGVIATIAGAVVGLAIALAVIAALDTDGVNQALFAIGGLFIYLGTMFAALGYLVDDDEAMKGISKAVSAMQGMAVSVMILAGAMRLIQTISWENLAKGLITIGLLGTGLVVAVKFLSEYEGPLMQGAAGFIFFAAGIRILAGALKTVEDLKWEDLAKGLIAVGTLIAGVALAINFTNFAGFGLNQGLGIVALAAGIRILTGAVQVFAGMDTFALNQGLGTFVALLASLAIAIHFMPNNLPLIGFGMMLFSSALLTISGAFALLSLLNGDALARSVAVIGIALAGFVIATKFMTNAIPGALAMLVVSAAIAVLVPAMLLLSTISWAGIVKALLTLAGIFAVFGVAGLLLGPMVPIILSLAGALALIGVAALATGAGITMLGVALATFGTGLTAFIANAGAIITIIIVDLLQLLPSAIGRGIITIVTLIGDAAEAIGIALVKVGVAILKAGTFLFPMIVQVGLSLITTLLYGIAEGIPDVVEAAFAVIIAFVNALAEAVRGNQADILAALGNLVSSVVELVFSVLEMLLKDIPVFGDKIVSALESGKEKVRKFFTPAEFSAMGSKAGKALGGSFGSGGKIDSAADSIATDGLDTLKSHTPEFEDVGTGFAEALGGSFASGGTFDNPLGDTFSSFGDISPNIRPVMDLSDLEMSYDDVNSLVDGSVTFDGYDDMMSQLNGISLGMDSFQTDNQSLADSVDSLHADNEIQNSKLDAMNASLNQYLPYMENMSNMQVVMDSGALVGELQGPMDRELGRRQVQSVRSGRA